MLLETFIDTQWHDFTMPQKEVPVHAVETSFNVIEALRKSENGTVSEIAELVDMPVSTVHVHLNTLCELEYITKDGSEYSLGLQFLSFGESAKEQTDLYEAAKPELEKLATETGEVTHLMIEEHGWGVHVFSAQGDDAVPLDTYSGKRIYLHQTGRGKAILSYLPDDKHNEILERRGLPKATENTITNRKELAGELAEIRDRGYAVDWGERIEGLACVAAPVTNDDQYPIGAISVAGPIGRLDEEYLNGELADKVRNTTNVIEFNMSFS